MPETRSNGSTAIGPYRPTVPANLPDDGEEGAIDWRRYIAALRRHRWWILLAMILGAAGGVVATRFVAERYFAVATIWIQTTEAAKATAIRGPIGTDQLLPATGAIQLVKSYVVLDQVVRDRQLYLGVAPKGPRGRTDRAPFATLTVGDDYRPGGYRLLVDPTGKTYQLFGAGSPEVEIERGTVGDSIGRTVGIHWAPTPQQLGPGTDVTFGLAPLRDAAQGLSGGLNVGVDPSGNFMRIALISGDPDAAAATVNAVAERYIAVATSLKRAKLTELARLLDDQLEAAKANLRKAEDALAGFRARTATLAPQTAAGLSGTAGGSDYFTLRLQSEQLGRDREAINRVLARPDSNGIEALSFIGAVQNSPDLTQALKELTTKRAELRALRYRYTDDYPGVRRLADEIAVLEGTTIPTLARTLGAELQTRAEGLAPHMAAGGRELQAVPRVLIDEARLRRDAELAAGLYAAVQQRQSEARLAEASSIADVRLLDRAVPPRAPMQAAGSRFVLLGLFGGLILGVIGAIVADHYDPRVRYPDQVSNEMGLRILGVLPHVKNRDAGPDDEQVAALIEAMRSVRLNVMHASGAIRPLLLTVTSPGIGDGKSFVALNLALACAQAGQRTVLIDGDARRGGLHRALETPRTPGLTDHLEGRFAFEGVVRQTRYPNLHFVSAGSRFRDAPELLGSPAMAELLTRLRGSYDVILIDSPPLGAGVDPYTIGTATGNMVLVVRTGATNRGMTRTHLAMLQQLPVRLLGAVLNDVRATGMYGYYSYYGYIAGYGSVDVVEDEAPRRLPERVTETSPP